MRNQTEKQRESQKSEMKIQTHARLKKTRYKSHVYMYAMW